MNKRKPENELVIGPVLPGKQLCVSLPVSSTQQAIPDYSKLKNAYDLHQGCILTEELTLSVSIIMRMSLFFLQFFFSS